MIMKLVPLFLAVGGLAGGAGAGYILRPDAGDAAYPQGTSEVCGPSDGSAPAAATPHAGSPSAKTAHRSDTEFVRLERQFVIPVVTKGSVEALVVTSLTLEVAEGAGETIYAREPKLRDLLLRSLLDHANTGGFSGSFTTNGSMDRLKRTLLSDARREIGGDVLDVLILDLNRQDA